MDKEKDFIDYVHESDETEKKVDQIIDAINSITEEDGDEETAKQKTETLESINQSHDVIKEINTRIEEDDDITDEDKLKYIEACENIDQTFDDFKLGESEEDGEDDKKDDSEKVNEDDDESETTVDKIKTESEEDDKKDDSEKVNEDDDTDLNIDDRLESEIRSKLGSMEDANKFEPQPTEINPDLTDDEIIALVTKEEEDSVIDSETGEATPTLTVQKQLGDVLNDLGLGDGTDAIKVVFEQALARRMKKGLEILRAITESKNQKEQLELAKKITEASTITMIKWFKENKTSIVEQQIVKSSLEASKIMVKALKEQKYNIDLPKNGNIVSKYKSLAEDLQNKNASLQKANKLLMKEQKDIQKEKMINEAKSKISVVSEKEKFAKIASSLIFENKEDFTSKLNILQKQFIKENKTNDLASKFQNQKLIGEQIKSKSNADKSQESKILTDESVAKILNSNLF